MPVKDKTKKKNTFRTNGKPKKNTRFDSLESKSTDKQSSFRKKTFRTDKPPENSRFKDLETKKNAFTQPSIRENSRWKREQQGKSDDTQSIHRNRDGPWQSSRDRRTNSRDRYNRDTRRQPSYRDRNRRRNEGYGRKDKKINNFTNKPPAFNVEKENFPTLLGSSNDKEVEIHRTTKENKENKHKQTGNQKEQSSDVTTIPIKSKNVKYYCYILGIQEDASKEDIKKAYHDLSLQYHPDRNDSKEAEEKFKEIDDAYKNLIKPKNFKTIVTHKKQKFKTVPDQSVEPGWVKMSLQNGKVTRQYGPPIKKMPRPRNIVATHKEIMAEMNERHEFWRDLDSVYNLQLGYLFREDEMQSDSEDGGYYSGGENNNASNFYDYDGY